MSARDAESLLFLDQAAVPPTPSPSQLDAPRPCPRTNWTPRVPAPVPTGRPASLPPSPSLDLLMFPRGFPLPSQGALPAVRSAPCRAPWPSPISALWRSRAARGDAFTPY